VTPRPTCTVVVPTRARASYLDAALRSIAPQARAADAGLLVVDDGADDDTHAVAVRHGAAYVAHDTPRGLNEARNTGLGVSTTDLVVFTDDDVDVDAGWLAALLDAAAASPDHGVFGGPIRPRLERERPLPTCGREGASITFLDLGPEDRDTDRVWGANMAIRRTAFEQVGWFDPALDLYGDEEDWQARLLDAGGRIRYVAAAGLDHRRAAHDATLSALARAARARGRNSRRYDARKGPPPLVAGELRVLAGCLWHAARRRCANGLVMAAHSAGRVQEALTPAPAPGAEDFLADASGEVAGRRGKLLAAADRALDLEAHARGRDARLARAAEREPPRRRVLVAGVDRPELYGLMDAARVELAASRHDVAFAVGAGAPGQGKFENLNALLAAQRPAQHDWLLVIDDDVVLPRGFLDRFLFLAERFDLALAQPAHRLHSHAAWAVTRRRPVSTVRETAFVEIGPVTAFRAETFDALLPFPPLRMGWGLDVHWAALAREHGWRLGVVDAVPVLHALGPPADAYPRDAAIAEARAFLEDRPYVSREEAQRTLAVHRGW
jgi:GT2 family glycosyltransferase